MNGFSESSHMDPKDTTQMCRLATSKTSPLGDSLEKVLSKKSGRRAFREFLRSEFCEENLDFWLTCEQFQTSVTPEALTPIATSIYEEFIRDDSPKQVNLDFNTRDVIRQNLQQPSPSCFVVAQKKIYSLMENDSFSRFTQSEPYRRFTDAASEQRGLRKRRMAMRKKKNGAVSKQETLQSGSLPLHKD